MSYRNTDIERITVGVASMNREAVKQELLQFEGRFKLDFTEDYLESLSLDRLRHILLAAKLQNTVN